MDVSPATISLPFGLHSSQDGSDIVSTGWNNLDIFVPQTQVYTALELVEEEAYTRARKANKQVWYYSSGVFDGPHGLDSDVELPAMRSRLLVGTVAFAHKVDGFLYYR